MAEYRALAGESVCSGSRCMLMVSVVSTSGQVALALSSDGLTLINITGCPVLEREVAGFGRLGPPSISMP